MSRTHSIAELPRTPAVYALMGGEGARAYVAYVGIAGNLRGRIKQHLVLRDSSVATGTSAATLNPDYVTEVRWWCDEAFEDRDALEAAEIVALDVLEPALRSRGKVTDSASKLAGQAAFRRRMVGRFGGEPTGQIRIPTLQDALTRIAELEARIERLERG